MKQNFLTIKGRLIILLVVVGLIPLLILSYVVLNRSHQALAHQAFAQLESINFAKKAQFEQYLKQIRADISVLANSTHLGNALDAFDSTLDTTLGTTGKNGALDKEQYNYFETLEYGDSFRQFIKEYGYYDLLLISQSGDIVYSTKREKDFNLNINQSPLSKQKFTKLFEQSLNQVVVTDFEIYPFSDSQVMAFLMSPIQMDGDSIGVVALKVTLDKINQIMLERSGMGETGESYLVGPDYLMRSNSYLEPLNHSVENSFLHPEKGQIKTEASLLALAGKSGEEILLDYRGVNALSIYTPVQWGDTRFALISEIDESEAFSVIKELKLLIIVIGLVLLILIIITATYIATVFTKPIRQLSDASIEISKGNIIKNIDNHRQDELGVLSENFSKMQDSIFNQINVIEQQKQELNQINSDLEQQVETRTNALELERQQLQSILDTSPVGVGITTDGVFRYSNSKMEKLLGIERGKPSPDVYVSAEERQQLMADLDKQGIVSNREIQLYDAQHQINDVLMTFMKYRYDNKDSILGWAVDLTERKKAEREIARSQQQLQAFFDVLGVGAALFGADGSILQANKISEKILGVSADEHVQRGLSSKKWQILRLDGTTMPVEEYPASRILAGEKSILGSEMIVVHPNGDEVTISISAAAIPEEVGGGVALVFDDVTEKNKIQQELSLLNQLVFGSLKAANVGAWWIDFSEEDTFHALDTTAQLIGLEVSTHTEKSYRISSWVELLNKTAEISDDFNQHIQNTLEQFSGTISGQYESYRAMYPIQRTDGSIRWMDARAEVTKRDDAGIALKMAGTLIDVTEIKEAEAKLEYQQNQFSSMVSNVPGAIYRVVDDSAWPILYMSDEIENITGYPASDFMDSKIVTFSTIMYPDDVGPIGKEIQEQFTQSKNFQVDYRVIARNGEIVWVRSQGQSIKSENGEAWIDGVLVDITEAKKSENELKIAKDVAEEATKAKSDFLANMSHEIRTPMNAIIGMSHLALQTELTPKQNNYIEKVNRSGEALLGIINDILDFSKIEAGKLDMESIDFRLEDVFENLASLLGLKAEENALELMFDIPPEIPTALIGDPLRLGQILINLGNNAVKFTEQGDIVFQVRIIEQDEHNTKLEFSVRDTGVGMTQEQQEKLFQSFSQADTSTTRKYGGTGLGLTISKKLTELMDGEIWVESEQSIGSTFYFTAQFKKQQGDVSPRRSTASDLGAMHVLIVDDNKTSREILSNMLASFGLRIDEAGTGEIALAQIDRANNSDPYQLVLMDWKMPDMDGMEVTRALQENSHLTEIPTVIMVTAYGREEASVAAEGLNISAFLTKPVTPSNLLDAIMIAMGHEVTQKQSTGYSHDGAQAVIAKLQGAHVLLVEDNEMNQELAIEILNSNGVSVVLAKDGQEALDILDKETFDGVLMDCQMPVMDGYTATRKLRKQEKYKDLPILAMTANAMISDKDKVLDAGMNDHITKPIHVKDMFTIMARWITPSNPEREIINLSDNNTADINAQTLSKDGMIEIPDIVGVEQDKGLSVCQGDKKLYLKLLLKFKEKAPGFINEFKVELKNEFNNGYAVASRVAHSFKSMAANIGALDLQSQAQKLEDACNQELAQQEIKAILSNLEVMLSTTLDSLIHLQQASPEKNVQESALGLDEGKLNELLEQLRILLKDDDAEAADIVEQIIELPGLASQKVKFEQLLEAIEEYDFDAALEALDSLDLGS